MKLTLLVSDYLLFSHLFSYIYDRIIYKDINIYTNFNLLRTTLTLLVLDYLLFSHLFSYIYDRII